MPNFKTSIVSLLVETSRAFILKNNEQRIISYDGRYIDGERLFSLVRNVIFV